jgi:DNA-binding transcriptional LysR family regulator
VTIVLNWELIRLFAIIADAGSMTKAARVSGVSQPTLSRSLKELERDIGGELFTRLPNQITLTALGEKIMGSIRAMQAASVDLADIARVETGQGRLPLRISATYSISQFLSAHIGECADRPELSNREIEIEPSRIALNPAHRKADILFRLRRIPDVAAARVRKVGVIAFAMYARKQAVHPVGVIGMTASRPPPQPQWVDDFARQKNWPVNFRLAEFNMRHAALSSGNVTALLPCFAGDADQDLCRITGPVPELEEEIFLMVHEDTASGDVVHLLADHLTNMFMRHAALLSGRSQTVHPPA